MEQIHRHVNLYLVHKPTLLYVSHHLIQSNEPCHHPLINPKRIIEVTSRIIGGSHAPPHLSLPSHCRRRRRRRVWVFCCHNTSATLANYGYNLCTYMSSIIRMMRNKHTPTFPVCFLHNPSRATRATRHRLPRLSTNNKERRWRKLVT